MRCAWWWLALLVVGCTAPASRERGAAAIFENVPLYRTPEGTRCDKFKKGGGVANGCDDTKYLADLYVRRLATGDEVCLEGGFGDKPVASCLARATVVDSATGRLLIEVREARPDSKWFQREQNQFWFEEGALVDLYLQDHGY